MNCRFAARFVPFGWRHERMLRRPQEKSATKASAVITEMTIRLPDAGRSAWRWRPSGKPRYAKEVDAKRARKESLPVACC